MREAPTASNVRAALVYAEATGVFTRRTSSGNQKAGAVAGTHDSKGYVQIRVNGRLELASRLAWLYVTGEWPVLQVEHRNGVRDDNRWCNLRLATQSENNQNVTARRTNKCGLLGVSWAPRRGRWNAQIQVGGKKKNLGYYETPYAAHRVYLSAKFELHPFQPTPRGAA